MAVKLNHIIVYARDKRESATFLADVLGLPAPTTFEPFVMVEVDNDVTLDFLDGVGEVASQHYAFLVTEGDFDVIFARIQERDVEHWADPGRAEPGTINTRDGGRGVYFEDPSDHLLEILTRPYGSDPSGSG